ncbi:MAG: hydrogenase iron-sulfur subunit [Usitatibacter sp.]
MNPVLALDEAVGAALDRVFPPDANPWRHLGSLAFLFFVICLTSGIYAYALFDTSIAGAYDSGRALSDDPLLLGRLARGLHRYGADAFMLTTVLHLAREAVRGHFRAYRAWSWLSGAVLVPLAWIAGITGFWLAWDERALYSAMASAEWIAAAPWHAAGIARNFVAGDAMNDRFFSLAVFVHIGVPLLALAATWAHFARLSGVRAWPPKPLAFGALGCLAVLALAMPPSSLGRADAFSVPAALAIDWFYFLPHVLADAITPEGLWAAVALAAAALIAAPWIAPRRRAPAAVVDLSNCNGCARCVADCPFAAVVMVPRSDGRPHELQAHVLAQQCAACGICAGACPSSTPFRRMTRFATGIDLPHHSLGRVRDALVSALAQAPSSPIVFACAPARLAARPECVTLGVECAAMVPPSFIEYALRAGARGVVVAGCREGDCEFRLGDRWTHDRIARVRQPALRRSVRGDRVRVLFRGSDTAAIALALDELRSLKEIPHA